MQASSYEVDRYFSISSPHMKVNCKDATNYQHTMKLAFTALLLLCTALKFKGKKMQHKFVTLDKKIVLPLCS